MDGSGEVVERGLDFEGFVTARGPALVRVAFLLCGDRSSAEDYVQSALAKAYVRWRKIRVLENPDAYVRKIVVNECRSVQRRKASSDIVTADPGVTASRADEVDAIARREWVHAGLGQLSPRARTVIVLRYLEDLSDEDIADLLGIRPSTVRSTAARALARLSDVLGDEVTSDDI